MLPEDTFTKTVKALTEEEEQKLEAQNSRLVPKFKAEQLEKDAQKHWDLFYKRNETRFFKDRRWTTREFEDLLSEPQGNQKNLFEIGCGVGNLIFPLIEENRNNYFYFVCDFSPRAVEFVKQNPLYSEDKVKAFQCDITTDRVFEEIPEQSLDIVTMIFVLSAIHPDKFQKVVDNLRRLLKPGGVVLFRDYGLYDMAQLRFKPGHKISENLYMRQDGTRSYYFTEEELADLFTRNGFEVKSNSYVHRRTLNVKEEIDVPRIFLQSKFVKS
ncbi:METTL6 family protein [Megaselia abdita]